jgi:RNA polymerase sigma-70 factor (ECF subfamily)
MLTATLPLMLEPVAAAPAIDPDRALVEAAAGGDVSAFEQLYRRHVGRVHGTLMRLAGQRAQAEDWTQEAFVRAWQKLPGFRHESAFASWLHRLAVNVALMGLRAAGSRVQGDGDEDVLAALPELAQSAPDLRMDLARAVACLPPRARAVLVLHDVEGWKHEEIGAELGMAVGTSKAQLHRARQALRRLLGDDGTGDLT